MTPPTPITSKRKNILLITEWPEARFQRGVSTYAKEANWHLSLDCVYGKELPWGWKGDGCLTSCCRQDIAEFTAALKVPVVDLYVPQAGRTHPTICEDNEAIGTLAADHFLARGFRNFANYSQDSLIFSRTRIRGFRSKLNAEGFNSRHLFWDASKSGPITNLAERNQCLIRELKTLPRPVAIFCVDDRLAVDIIECCLECGLNVPYDVSVMGVGDLELAGNCAAVPLTSVSIGFESFGYQAASILDQILEGHAPPAGHSAVPPTGIKIRHSTSLFALEDPKAQEALQYMQENLHNASEVPDAARSAGLTPRQFTEITKKELGMSPVKLLELIRLQKAIKLLVETDYTVDGIAEMIGLKHRARLERIFRRQLDTTPSEWRKQPQDPDALRLPQIPRPVPTHGK